MFKIRIIRSTYASRYSKPYATEGEVAEAVTQLRATGRLIGDNDIPVYFGDRYIADAIIQIETVPVPVEAPAPTETPAESAE